MAIQPFQWFGNQAVTPQNIAARRKVAEALAASSPNPQTFWEGLQNATGKVGGAVLDWKAGQDEAGAQSDYAAKLAALGDNPSRAQLEQLAGDPFANQGQSAVVQALLSSNLKNSDPDTLLDRRYKTAQIDALAAKPAIMPTDDQRELSQINDERTKAGQEPLGMEDFLTSKKGNGITITNPDGTTTQIGGSGKALTENQSKDTYYVNQGAAAIPTIDKMGDALTNLGEGVGGQVPLIGNYLKSSDYQQAEQAGRQFLNALLRKESGAAISETEDRRYGDAYLPRPGDKPPVLAQKKAARANALLGIKMGLPPAAVLALTNAGVDFASMATEAAGGPPAPSTKQPIPGFADTFIEPVN